MKTIKKHKKTNKESCRLAKKRKTDILEELFEKRKIG